MQIRELVGRYGDIGHVDMKARAACASVILPLHYMLEATPPWEESRRTNNKIPRGHSADSRYRGQPERHRSTLPTRTPYLWLTT